MTEPEMPEQKMNEEEVTEREQRKLAEVLKQSLTSMNRELDRDLWPKMLQRLDQNARQRNWFAVLFSPAALSSVPWFDWALLAVIVVGICIFPRSIPVWLYHF
ncbi:MAG: hypothetical protein ABSF93_09475 [Candidatus Sulfotelmatobacter sp.]|jgi:hypothetical protein